MAAASGLGYDMDSQVSFRVAYAYLKSRVEYVFASQRMNPDTWCVSYWSIKVQRSPIMKQGTETNKARLPEVTRRNRARSQTVQTSSDGRQVKRRRIQKPL